MVTCTFGTIAAPQGLFSPGQSVNLPAADAARCVALGVGVLAPGAPQSPGSLANWPNRAENNLGAFPIGSVAFSGQPVTGSSIGLNGTAVGFVTSGATGLQVNLGGSLATTLASLLALLSASTDPNISQAVYSVTGSTLNVYSQGVFFVLSGSTSPAANATCVNAGP